MHFQNAPYSDLTKENENAMNWPETFCGSDIIAGHLQSRVFVSEIVWHIHQCDTIAEMIQSHSLFVVFSFERTIILLIGIGNGDRSDYRKIDGKIELYINRFN